MKLEILAKGRVQIAHFGEKPSSLFDDYKRMN